MDDIPNIADRMYLPCNHWYHVGCIDLWLTDHNTCPTCRAVIPGLPKPVYEYADSSDGEEDEEDEYDEEEEEEEYEEGEYEEATFDAFGIHAVEDEPEDDEEEEEEDEEYDEDDEDEESEWEDYSESAWNNASEFQQGAQDIRSSPIPSPPASSHSASSHSESWSSFRKDLHKMRREMEDLFPEDAEANDENDNAVLALITGMGNLSLYERIIWEDIE